MNNIISNFSQILNFAKQADVPVHFQRAILREYLQSMAIARIFAMKESQKLIFVGGTSLRLLRNIDRFSEDLDFDNLGLSDNQFGEVVSALQRSFMRENITVELKKSIKEHKQYYELKFPNLLFDLNISSNDKEKIMIKIDQSNFWQGQTPEVMLFAKYGFIEQINTNSLNQLLVQKLAAYISRKQTQPRDIYDIVWLFSAGARIDEVFCSVNHLHNLAKQAQQKYQSEGITKVMQNRLQPFLFTKESVQKLSLFAAVLDSLVAS
jgi:predicted nucleotidyltransferase component of viral defense system